MTPQSGESGPSHPEKLNPIVRFSVERRVTMGMAVLGVIVLGWLSLERMPLEFLPNFDNAEISVSVPYRSSSPEEVERLIVRPLEDSLGTINGLDRLQSRASSNDADINMSFVAGTDMELIAVEVRDRIDRVRDRLPADVENIRIRRFQTTNIPVLRTNVAAPWPVADLFEFLETVVQPRLERLEGVAQVDVRGLRSRQLSIDLIPARVEAHRVDVRQLGTTLRQNHINVSGGYLREGSRRLLVRTMGELASVKEIRELPIRADGLKLGDIAEVHFDYPEQTSFSYLNGAEAVYLQINKVSSSNLLQVVQRVKAELEEIQKLPEAEGLEIRHFHDASVDVEMGLSELGKAGLVGGGLAIVFMFFFLRKFRTTALVAVAVPLSLVMTFVIMYLSRQGGLIDISLNVVSLSGLMLAVGMLLDNSIVVIESIFRHRQDLGEDSKTAALRGASEVAMPIIASTATTMCVFIPTVFFSQGVGRFGRFMGVIGMTVCIVMLSSLVISLTVVPMVAAMVLRGESRRRSATVEMLTKGYGALLRFTLRHRLAFVVLVSVLLIYSWQLFHSIERSFSPPSEGRQITLFVDTPSRFSVDERGAVYQQVYDLLDGHREDWEIADIAHQFGSGGGRSRGHGYGGGNRFELFLTPEEEAALRTSEIQDRIRQALPTQAGVSFKIAQTQAGRPGSGSSGINLELSGDSLDVLEFLSPEITSRLAELPFLQDVDSSLESGDDEIRVSVNRDRALLANMSSAQVANSISAALSSRSLSYFKAEDREVGMVMQYREEDRETLDQLQKMPMFQGGEATVPISSVADFSIQPGARTIDRENRRSRITISANVAGDMPSFAAMGPVSGVLGSVALPEGYEWSFGRRFMEAQADESNARFSWFFAVLLIFLITAGLFENFAQPLSMMLSIPCAYIGVAVVMRLAHQPRSDMTDMGMTILAGIVVNNAIVLIDHINRLRRQGMARGEAILLGGQHRLRPILMTAITTILGLTPMVAPFFLPEIFGQPEGRAANWAPIGMVILGGLTTSTLLTLLVTPTVYSLIDDFTRFCRRVVATVASPLNRQES